MKTIPHLNKRLSCVYELDVKVIGENEFELVYCEPFDFRYTTGTIIKTKINSEGQHEIIDFKKSLLKTERYLLQKNQKEKLLAFFKEFGKLGGIPQIDMEGILYLSFPKESSQKVEILIKNHSLSNNSKLLE